MNLAEIIAVQAVRIARAKLGEVNLTQLAAGQAIELAELETRGMALVKQVNELGAGLRLRKIDLSRLNGQSFDDPGEPKYTADLGINVLEQLVARFQAQCKELDEQILKLQPEVITAGAEQVEA